MIDTRVRDEVTARQRMKWACKRCPHTAIHWETVLKVQHRPGDNSKCWALMALRNSEGRLWDLHLEVMILLCTQTIQTGKERRIMSELASLCHYSSSKLRAQEYGPHWSHWHCFREMAFWNFRTYLWGSRMYYGKYLPAWLSSDCCHESRVWEKTEIWYGLL